MRRLKGRGLGLPKAIAFFVSTIWSAGPAFAYKFETAPEWDVNFDNTVQYTVGWRMQDPDSKIANHPAFYQGDAKFQKGDVVTNRIQDLIELQAVYKGRMGIRVSGSVWKDWAYDDNVEVPETIKAFYRNNGLSESAACSYENCKYSDYTKKYYMQGGELLDAFVFANTEIGDTPVYAKLGRLAQYWGNSFFFGFSNIAYSQSPVDFVKAFANPGSEVKELFLPRKQVLLATELSPEVSAAFQYFYEYRPNRYPESGTYLGFFDPLFNGPQLNTGFSSTNRNDGIVEPEDNNDNFGVKIGWSPSWLGGDLGFYYRQFDEVQPWMALINPKTDNLYNPVNEKAKLVGVSLEKSFGLLSMGLELNQRRDTALHTVALAKTDKGASGTLTNLIANAFVQLGSSPFWDSGILIGEASYTHLDSVTGNPHLYNGVGTANCRENGTAAPGSWRDGCATNNALALAVLFEPQWLQVAPGLDLALPMSYTWGAHGNPAYAASPFYANGTNLYSIGVKATYQSKNSMTLQYNGYRWRPNGTAQPFGPSVPESYAGFGGAGAPSLNDRGWLQLSLKTSF